MEGLERVVSCVDAWLLASAVDSSLSYCIVSLSVSLNRLLVGKPEEKRPLGRPRRRWVDNIRLDLGEMGWGDVD
jgi:hypothetical protein